MSSQALQFKNYTDTDFTHSFDSVPYTFKAGQTIYLEEFKAKHFAKHLVNRELNAKNIPTNNLSERAKLEVLCFPSEEAVTPLEALNINETVKAVEKKKAGKTVKKVEEEEFSELNNK